ncbi:MAG: pre-peptidase C-terminal domain-containing protein, partial [Chloroflexota bacterium]
GNVTEATPPTGEILMPVSGSAVLSNTLQILGQAEDADNGLSYVQIWANYEGNWQQISPDLTTSPFVYDWGMCADDVPDGPLSLALKAWDNSGNPSLPLTGLVHVGKHYTCPPQPPDCEPAANQVSLFAEPGFGGACVTLDSGDWADASPLASLGGKVASVKVGDNVWVTLFSQANYQGRAETFWGEDSNLADSRLANSFTGSLRVHLRTQTPNTPTIIWPPAGATFPPEASLSLSAHDNGGAALFQMQQTSSTGTVTSSWQTSPLWSLGSLAPDTYTWQVRAQNDAGNSSWSTSVTITVSPPSASSPEVVELPFFDDLEGGTVGWTNTGLWHLATSSDKAHSGTHVWWYGDDGEGTYDTGGTHSGDLTSPPILVNQNDAALTFWYSYQTESSTPHWDQRWVQLSVDGGPFFNLLQLGEDMPNMWHQAPVFSLSLYEGHTVRLRLHFETLDGNLNNYGGWYIDDLSVARYAPMHCPDGYEFNDTPAQATLMTYGTTLTADICPNGDMDVYSFVGQAGDRIVVDIDAQVIASPLDAIVMLYDSDGTSLLAEHDDEVEGVWQDPHLSFVLTHDGTYYLKLKSWDHPTSGGETYSYTLTLLNDMQLPTLLTLSHAEEEYIPAGLVNLYATAADAQSGVSHVEFLWHSADWQDGVWELVGDDWEGGDGWGASFDAGGLASQKGIAFYAQAYNWAGHSNGIGVWNLTVDGLPPATMLLPLAPTQASTAFQLEWTGSDDLSGLVSYDLQYRQDGGTWVDHQVGIASTESKTWFVGDLGHLYDFRMRGVDKVNNTEAYPAEAETLTFVLTCTPDTWEDDDNPQSAHELVLGGDVQTHSFCGVNDVDWLRFTAQVGDHYQITAIPQQSATAAKLELYAADGQTVLASASSSEWGQPAILSWTSDRNASVYLAVRHTDGRVAGNAIQYQIQLTQSSYVIYFPLIEH